MYFHYIIIFYSYELISWEALERFPFLWLSFYMELFFRGSKISMCCLSLYL